MLELRNIKKVYPAGNGEVEALKGIDLKFRESEFVSILGQSGCGKTTLFYHLISQIKKDFRLEPDWILFV